MITKATVIRLDGTRAIVEAERKSACEGCHKQLEGESCSVCTLMGGDNKITSVADNTIGAVVGDVVQLESRSSRILAYAALVFLFPLFVATAFYFLAPLVWAAPFAPILAALIGLVLAFCIVWCISKFVIEKRCDVKIVKILSRP